ncbi:MAG: sulfotransferase [Deltaproteobacteria bacterium]|nr:sulfotransferase [Deltaproteobacteria bacterium]
MVLKRFPPIFIGGLFKSGTSLLRAMLGQHSDIATGLESYWFDLDWDGPRDKKFNDHVARLQKFYGMNGKAVSSMVSQSKSSLDFLDRFMTAYAKMERKKRWAEKTPGNILHLDRIYKEFPGAKVIHIVRDPKDVFASLRQAGKWDEVQVFVDIWCRFFGSAATHAEKLDLGPEKYITIRYENLVIDPVKTMRFVIDFLEEEWEDSIARFAGKGDEYEKVLAITGKASTTLDRLGKPLAGDRIGIWKTILPESQIIAIRNGVGENGLLPLFMKIEEDTLSLRDKDGSGL